MLSYTDVIINSTKSFILTIYHRVLEVGLDYICECSQRDKYITGM